MIARIRSWIEVNELENVFKGPEIQKLGPLTWLIPYNCQIEKFREYIYTYLLNLFHWPVYGELASISHPTWRYLLLAIAWAWFVNHLPFVKCQILLSCSTLTAHRGSGPRSRCANRIPFRNRSFVQKPTEPPHFFPRSLSLSTEEICSGQVSSTQNQRFLSW